jgi:hypothetical protein
MLYIILFATILYGVSSLTPPNPYHQKKCINCEFFLAKKKPFMIGLDNTPDYGQCSLFKKEHKKYNKFISDEEMKDKLDLEFYHCTSARAFNDMCGEEGRFYRKRKTSKKLRFLNKIKKLFDYLDNGCDE